MVLYPTFFPFSSLKPCTHICRSLTSVLSASLILCHRDTEKLWCPHRHCEANFLGMAEIHPGLAEVDVSHKLPDDHDVDARHDLRFEARSVCELWEDHSWPQVGKSFQT